VDTNLELRGAMTGSSGEPHAFFLVRAPNWVTSSVYAAVCRPYISDLQSS
jgi:hypothetical protein